MLQVGRYRIRRRLGRGGLAEVFEAEAVGEGGFTRRVALKRLRDEWRDDPEAAELLMHEARVASGLHHASIVPVLDCGVAEGLPFVVFALVDGLDADRFVTSVREQGGELPPAVAVFIALEVARALDHAHRARDEQGRSLGIVHRDVSPHNVLLSWDGDVQLSDFGVALLRDRTLRTRVGMVRGKPGYMAPEQFLGGTVDARADLFALGCTLHALCTGQSPLQHERAMEQLLLGNPLELGDGLPPHLSALLLRATRRDRDARFATADEMAEALSELLEELGGPARARRTLREMLESRRPAPVEQPPPRPVLFELEALLGMPEAESPAPRARTRTFTLQEVPQPPEPAPSPQPAELAPPERRSRRYLWALGLLPLLLAIPLALSRREVPRPQPPPAPRVSPAPPTALPVSPPPPAPAPPPVLPVPPAPALNVPPPPPTELPPRVPHAPPRAPASAPAPPPAPSPPPTPPPPPPAEAGESALVVGGEGALRALVRVDGRPAGHAPTRLLLAPGTHHLEVLADDGRVLSDTRVELTAAHTLAHPYRLLLP